MTDSQCLAQGNILATAFAGLIAAGVFQMDGAAGLTGVSLFKPSTILAFLSQFVH